MKYTYNKPSIEIKNWFITIKDLKRIYDYLSQRFNNPIRSSIKLTTGEEINFHSFDDFEKEINLILENKDKVDSIFIIGQESNDKFNKEVYVMIQFSNFHSAIIYIKTQYDNTSLKDWTEGTYNELSKIAKSCEENDEYIEKTFKEKNITILFDPLGNEKSKILELKKIEKTEIKPVNINNLQVHLGHGDQIGRDKIINNNLPDKKQDETLIKKIIIGIVIAVIGGIVLYFVLKIIT